MFLVILILETILRNRANANILLVQIQRSNVGLVTNMNKFIPDKNHGT